MARVPIQEQRKIDASMTELEFFQDIFKKSVEQNKILKELQKEIKACMDSDRNNNG